MASVKGMFRSAHFAATITFAAIQALGFRKLVANFHKSVQRSIGTRGVRPGCRGRDGRQTAVADGIRAGYAGEDNEDKQGQNVEASHLRNFRDGQRAAASTRYLKGGGVLITAAVRSQRGGKT